MDFLPSADNARPAVRILVFGHKEFSQLMSRVVGRFRTVADCKLHDAIVGSASEVQPLIRQFDPHVIISGGANAAYLESVLEIPVVSIHISDEDWIDAVTRASQVSSHVDVVCFNKQHAVLSLLAKDLNIHINQHVYHTSDQAREKFHILRQTSNTAVVGASLVCGLATQYDIPSFLVYSESSCQHTVEKAIEVGEKWRNQIESKTLTDWLLTRSKTPIILTNRSGTSYKVNKAAKQDLGIIHEKDFDIHALIQVEQNLLVSSDGECRINGKDWWYHCDQVASQESHRYVYQLYKKQPSVNPVLKQLKRAPEMIAASPQMHVILDQVAAFAHSPGNVLIFGESGTGKELVARRVHSQGQFSQGQFVAVNCGAIPSELFEGELFGYVDGAYTGAKRGGQKGLIETARDGVLFLDEISELSPIQQTKLLRFIQERCYRPVGANEEIDVQVKLIAASNRQLDEMVANGEFREDLFYRLNVFKINVPALRDRPEDLEAICIARFTALLEQYAFQADPKKLSDLTLASASDYQWPGNIRELENICERIVAWVHIGGDIERLPSVIRQIVPEFFTNNSTQYSSESGVIKLHEKQIILDAMQYWNGDRRKVAENLGISPTTLWRRLKKLNYKD